MALTNMYAGYILLVDDIIDNLEMLTDMLDNKGYEVQIALDGQEALDKIGSHPPDLVLLDIQMPGMDGYEVCRRIKANPATADIPVIFLSALSETEDIVKGFDAGGVDYVSKPFKYREVMARVESQLAVSRQRKEIEALRVRDKRQFEVLDEMKNDFLYGAAHDFKNPLTGVLLYIQVLRSTPPEDKEELVNIANGIEQSARKMERLVTDILDLAEMQVENKMRFIEFTIQPFIQRSVENAEILAKEKNISLYLTMPDEKVVYPVAQNYFERMLDNLISNAIKYTPDGGEIAVELKICEDCYMLSVSDTGIGIPEDAIPNLFDAFYRVKKETHKRENGTGLGLSMVAVIVDEHGGDITVESEEGKGSTFSITLPMEY